MGAVTSKRLGFAEPVAGPVVGSAFRSRTKLDDSPEALRQTRLAVLRAKEGDMEAMRFLYACYSHNVYGYVRSIVRHDHDAEDVTQHLFAKLMTTLHKYDDRGLPFFAWLLRLARNAAIDHLRANRQIPAELDPAASATSQIDRSLALRDALGVLPRTSAKWSCCATSSGLRRVR